MTRSDCQEVVIKRPEKLKDTLNSFFKLKKLKRRSTSGNEKDRALSDHDHDHETSTNATNDTTVKDEESEQSAPKAGSPFVHRALPPVPRDGIGPISDEDSNEANDQIRILDYAASIEKVKDCGWYWGPVSGDAAEKLLENEPDGSFIVRDSSDEHYIFSLTFKLNGLVRHVRIEQDQGNFSFGCLQKFRSNTIVDFIEDAVEHSRSGRFLFFLHRRAVVGPMRVQLLHPVSRFKRIQSLQHLCRLVCNMPPSFCQISLFLFLRFVLLKYVRRDLITELPLPPPLQKYLSYPSYYTEEME